MAFLLVFCCWFRTTSSYKFKSASKTFCRVCRLGVFLIRFHSLHLIKSFNMSVPTMLSISTYPNKITLIHNFLNVKQAVKTCFNYIKYGSDAILLSIHQTLKKLYCHQNKLHVFIYLYCSNIYKTFKNINPSALLKI